DVERAHRELGARLANRLRRNDADRLAHVHRRTAGKIAPVALGAHAVGGLAGENRTDLHLLDARLVDQLDVRFLDQRVALHDDFPRGRILDVLGRGTAENADAKRSHDRAAVDDRARLDATLGLAVVDRDDRVLRDVDQTAREVTRVRGLQGGVGQTFAG